MAASDSGDRVDVTVGGGSSDVFAESVSRLAISAESPLSEQAEAMRASTRTTLMMKLLRMTQQGSVPLQDGALRSG